jgi:hypothetical protein
MASLSDWSMPCPGSSPLNGRTGSGVGADRGWGVWSLVNAVVVEVARCREGHCRHFVTDRPLAPTIFDTSPAPYTLRPRKLRDLRRGPAGRWRWYANCPSCSLKGCNVLKDIAVVSSEMRAWQDVEAVAANPEAGLRRLVIGPSSGWRRQRRVTVFGRRRTSCVFSASTDLESRKTKIFAPIVSSCWMKARDTRCVGCANTIHVRV